MCKIYKNVSLHKNCWKQKPPHRENLYSLFFFAKTFHVKSVPLDSTKSAVCCTHCGNYGILLPQFFRTFSVKLTFLLKNFTVDWFDEKNLLGREFLIFPHSPQRSWKNTYWWKAIWVPYLQENLFTNLQPQKPWKNSFWWKAIWMQNMR